MKFEIIYFRFLTRIHNAAGADFGQQLDEGVFRHPGNFDRAMNAVALDQRGDDLDTAGEW